MAPDTKPGELWYSPEKAPRYMIDLEDESDFPDVGSVPVAAPDDETWFFLAEVLAATSTGYTLQGKAGERWSLTFDPMADKKSCDVGKVVAFQDVCVMGPTIVNFSTAQQGFRITTKNEHLFKVYPFSLAAARALNKKLIKRSEAGNHHACLSCDTDPAKLTCGRCKGRYCSAACQKKDWPQHKGDCKVMEALLRWNATRF